MNPETQITHVALAGRGVARDIRQSAQGAREQIRRGSTSGTDPTSVEAVKLIALADHLDDILAKVLEDCEEIERACARTERLNAGASGSENGSPPGRASDPSEGVGVLVRGMSAAGLGRAEIAARLRSDYGVGDSEATIEAILGSKG